MKITLNNQNVTLKHINMLATDCYQCCFFHNLGLCGVLELRDYTICRTVKILDNAKLNDVFVL